MKDIIPLCMTRIWCRKNEAWLSFKTATKDRFLVSPEGYFLELPDGSLTRISPRTTFPIIDRFPSIVLSELVPRKQFGEDAFFISVPLRSQQRQDPVRVPVEEIAGDPLTELAAGLAAVEHYVLLRAVENGLVSFADVPKLLAERSSGRSIGELLIANNLCHWETLLAQALDIRPPSRLDPPHLRTIIERREWELIGEVLVAMDRINRTELEHALKVKRDGNQALGQILTAMGACKKEDVQQCLRIQEELKHADHEGVVLIGKLLVSQGVIADTDLEEVLWKQRVARQPLGRILVSMGACSQREIDQYEAVHGGGFQQSVDEAAMGNYLVKTDTISKIQLEEAMRVQQRGRQVLGEMLVALGLCSPQDIEEVLTLQNQVREAHRSGLQRLGDLLIKRGNVPSQMVDEALKLQSIGRQPFGSILVAMGACTPADINEALAIQHEWRSRPKEPGDRLGEVLVHSGILTQETLEEPLLQHMREEKPLGRILIENKVCKPEQILGTLIDRDNVRQEEFMRFVRSHLPSAQVESVAEPPSDARKVSGRFAAAISTFLGNKQKQK